MLSKLKYLSVSGKLLSFWGGTIQIRFIDIDCITVFYSLLFFFLEIAKKSLNLFNVSLGTKSNLLKHPVAGITDNLLKNFALAVGFITFFLYLLSFSRL